VAFYGMEKLYFLTSNNELLQQVEPERGNHHHGDRDAAHRQHLTARYPVLLPRPTVELVF
jgi:hypothetical protein